MALTISQKGSGLQKLVSPSNKDGVNGFREAYAFQLPDNQTVSVSRPFIDRIALIGVIPASVYGHTVDKDGEATAEGPKQIAALFKEAIRDQACGLKKPKNGKSSFAKGSPKPGEKLAYIKVGLRRANVDVRLQPMWGPNKTILDWRLRLEWNPRKAGREGFERLWQFLAGYLLFEAEGANEWFRRAEVTRLDISVDLIGARRTDLFTVMPLQKKVISHGRWATGLETITHRATDGPKGKAGLIVYDKRQERIDAGKLPKFGDLPHQRIERRLAFTGGSGPVVSQLHREDNRLADVTVRYMRNLPEGPSRFDQQIVAGAALWLGWKELSKSLKGPLSPAWKTLRTRDGFFWNAAKLWESWPDAVDEAGLGQFAER